MKVFLPYNLPSDVVNYYTHCSIAAYRNYHDIIDLLGRCQTVVTAEKDAERRDYLQSIFQLMRRLRGSIDHQFILQVIHTRHEEYLCIICASVFVVSRYVIGGVVK